MTQKTKLGELLATASRQTPEEITVIQAHNDRVEKRQQLIDYTRAAIGVALIAIGLLWAAHSQLQQLLAIISACSLGIIFGYFARRGYHGHQPHISILLLICIIVFAIAMICYMVLFF